MTSIDQLKEMFPNVEERTVEALLIASQGAIEPATNALLYLSDPNSNIKVPTSLEEAPPPPPRPNEEELIRRKQMKEDEELAKKLAQSYQRKPQPRRPTTTHHEQNPTNNNAASDDDDEDDLVDAFNKNLNEAKNIVGGWFGNVAKKLQGEEGVNQSGPKLPERYHNQSVPFSNDNIKPHYEQVDENLHMQKQPPSLPARKSSSQLYSALDTEVRPSEGITLHDVTGDNNAQKEVEPVSKSRINYDSSKDKKWEKLTDLAPEPSAATSTSTATATADDSEFVVDDSEDEEEDQEQNEKNQKESSQDDVQETKKEEEEEENKEKTSTS